MRFATFNICSGRSPADGRVDLDRFAAAIADLDADVLALQEVDRDQERSRGADLTALAGDAMGADHRVFAPALYGTPGRRWRRATDRAEDGPAYGCALLSRVPLQDVAVHRIPAAPVVVPLWIPGTGPLLVREEPRVAIVAGLDDGRTVVATHLPFTPAWKQWQLRRLVDHLRSRIGPLLLLGDLNVRGGAAARVSGYRALASAATFPAPSPRLQLDHVLARGDVGRVVRTDAPRLRVSDHRPLVVDLESA